MHEYVSCSSKAFLRKYIDEEKNEENRKNLTELAKMISTLHKKISQRL